MARRPQGTPPTKGFQQQVHAQPPFSRGFNDIDEPGVPHEKQVDLLKARDLTVGSGAIGANAIGSHPIGGGPAARALERDATHTVEPSGPLATVVPRGFGALNTNSPADPGVEITPPPANIAVKTHPPRVSAGKKRSSRAKRAVVIRNKAQVIDQVHALVGALEEATGYDPQLHHNQKQPDLYGELNISDPTTREDIRQLVGELKRLNDFLENTAKPRTNSKPVVDVKKHLNTFLGKCATTAGYGAGLLLVAVAANILHSFGVNLTIMPIPIGTGHK